MRPLQINFIVYLHHHWIGWPRQSMTWYRRTSIWSSSSSRRTLPLPSCRPDVKILRANSMIWNNGPVEDPCVSKAYPRRVVGKWRIRFLPSAIRIWRSSLHCNCQKSKWRIVFHGPVAVLLHDPIRLPLHHPLQPNPVMLPQWPLNLHEWLLWNLWAAGIRPGWWTYTKSRRIWTPTYTNCQSTFKTTSLPTEPKWHTRPVSAEMTRRSLTLGSSIQRSWWRTSTTASIKFVHPKIWNTLLMHKDTPSSNQGNNQFNELL